MKNEVKTEETLMNRINKGEYEVPDEFKKLAEEQARLFMRAQINGIVNGVWQPAALDFVEEDVSFSEHDIEMLAEKFVFRIDNNYKFQDEISEMIYDMCFDVLDDYFAVKYGNKEKLVKPKKKGFRLFSRKTK